MARTMPIKADKQLAAIVGERSQVYTCCRMPLLQHLGTCHDCGAVEVPMDPRWPDQRGEPICVNCARQGAFDP